MFIVKRKQLRLSRLKYNFNLLNHSYLLLLLLFSCSVVSGSVVSWTETHHPFLYFIISQSVPKIMFIESVMSSNHLVLSSPSPPAFKLFQL